MLCKPYEVVQNYEVADVRLNLPFQSCSIPIVNVGRWVGNLQLGMGPPQRKVLQNLSADLRSFFIFYECHRFIAEYCIPSLHSMLLEFIGKPSYFWVIIW